MHNAIKAGLAVVAPIFLQACSSDPHMCQTSEADYESAIANKPVFSHFLPIWTGKVMVMVPQYRQEPRTEVEKQVLREQHGEICAGVPEASR